MSERKNVGIWIRVSTEDQAKGESPENHLKRARFYAESKDWHVEEVYHLEGVSGALVADHPETLRMLEDVTSGRISGLIFSKLARLARSTAHLLSISNTFREHGADLISLQESLDTSSPAGRLLFTIIAALAEWERDEIADRIRASIPVRAKLGRPLSGATVFGYRWQQVDGTKVLTPDPTEAPVRKLLYELFAEHKRLKTVARLLNERGHRTRAGKRWSDTAVKRLIEDPTAKGKRRSNFTTRPTGKTRTVLKPEGQWFWHDVEPIISEELWARCNDVLDKRRHGKRPGRTPRHVFSGIVYCSCGSKMYVASGYPKYRCHACHNKIAIDDLDAVYQEQLRGFTLSPEQLKEHFDEGDRIISEKTELLATLQTEAQRTNAALDRLVKALADGEIPSKGFGLRYRPVEERFNQLQDEIPRLQAELDFMRIERLSSDQIVSEAQDLATRWPDLTDDEKRTVVENVTDRITVGENEINIELFCLPATDKTSSTRQRSHRALSSRPRMRSSRGGRSWRCRGPPRRGRAWDVTR